MGELWCGLGEGVIVLFTSSYSLYTQTPRYTPHTPYQVRVYGYGQVCVCARVGNYMGVAIRCVWCVSVRRLDVYGVCVCVHANIHTHDMGVSPVPLHTTLSSHYVHTHTSTHYCTHNYPCLTVQEQYRFHKLY